MKYGDSRLSERFWSKTEEIGSCWEWAGYLCKSGYGRFWDNGTYHSAHRVSFTAAVGSIPPGLELDHLCFVKRCVNPAHLEPVTHKENTMRSSTVGAVNAAKTHCKQGHPFSGENLVLFKYNKLGSIARGCKICRRNRSAKYKLTKQLSRAKIANQ